MSLIKILSELVSIQSPYPNEEKIGAYVKEKLLAMKFKVDIQKVENNRFNILAEKGEGPALLIFGHLDTVEEKIGWKTNPYTLIQVGDKLYGLGSWDMKAGLAAILSAVKDFVPGKHSFKLAFVVDEEFISLGMNTLMKSGWLSNIVGAVCPEPGFDHGVRGIAMGRIGRPVYRIIVKTKGGHVYFAKSRPNAIEETNKVLTTIKKIKPVHHKYLGSSYLFPRSIKSKAQSMTIPDSAEIEVEGQTVPPQSTQSVLRELRRAIFDKKNRQKINAEVFINLVPRRTSFCESFVVDKKNSFVKFVSKILEDAINKKPVFYYRRSVGDENRIATLGIPVVTIGPSGGNAHEANEWVSKESLLLLESFFKRLISNFSIKEK